MATIKDMFIMATMIVAGFGIMLLFVNNIAVDNGAIVDSRINDTYTRLQEQNAQFESVRKNFENLSDSAREADLGDFAYFGIRGMVAIMKAPLSLITTVYNGVQSIAYLFANYVPIQLINAIAIIAMVIMLFQAIKFLTSRGQEP